MPYEPSRETTEAFGKYEDQRVAERQARWRERQEFERAAHLWLVGKAVDNEYAQFLLRELEDLEAYRKDD